MPLKATFALTQTPEGVSSNQDSSVCLFVTCSCALRSNQVSESQFLVSEVIGYLRERVLDREAEVEELSQGLHALLTRLVGG